MNESVRLAIWTGVLLAILAVGMYVILAMRKRFFTGGDDDDQAEEDKLYTTANIERLRSDGVIDQEQYEKLKEKVDEASRRRADSSKKKKPNHKSGIFG